MEENQSQRIEELRYQKLYAISVLYLLLVCLSLVFFAILRLFNVDINSVIIELIWRSIQIDVIILIWSAFCLRNADEENGSAVICILMLFRLREKYPVNKKQREFWRMIMIVIVIMSSPVANLILAVGPIKPQAEKPVVEKAVTSHTPDTSQVEFISSINSKLYHTTDCRYAEQILSKNLSTHGSRADAEVLGKLPCDVCIYASPLVISAEELSEDAELTEKPWHPPIPHSGMRFLVPKDDCIVPFSVTTGSSNIVIYMRDLDRGKNNMAFMVRANDCIERNVPVGDYKVYYATGTDWYGEYLLFGEDTEYYSIKDTFYFYAEVDTTDTWRSGVIPETVRTYQIELLPEPGGMLEASEISSRLFPQFNKD